MYPTQHGFASAYAYQPYAAQSYAAPEYPDIRPLITRHRLRRQRRRKAATLLTGASIALSVAALRTPSASAQSPKTSMPVAHPHEQPGDQLNHEPLAAQPPAPG